MTTPKPFEYFRERPILGAISAELGLLSFTKSTIFFPFVFIDFKRQKATKVDKACNLNWPSLRSNLNAYLSYGENIKVDQAGESHLMLPAWRTTCGAFFENESVVGRHQDGGYLVSYRNLWEKNIMDIDPDNDFVKMAANGSTVAVFHAKSKDEGMYLRERQTSNQRCTLYIQKYVINI